MKKLITSLFVLTLLCSLSTFAQWQYAGAFPPDTLRGGSGAHGAAVDAAGKIWLQLHTNTGDSIFDGTANRPVRPIFVYNPNGTPASFSPIKVIAGPGFTDTLWGSGGGVPSANVITGRGLRRDHQGNVLASIFDRVYRINHTNGAGMNKVVAGANNSIGAVGVNTLGEFFVQTVVGGNPIRIYDAGFNYLGNVTDTSRGFHRSLEVSADGNDVYSAGYTLHYVLRYHSDNGSFGPYAVGPNDTLFRGFDCESFGWNPTRTRLWASSGSANDRPNRDPGATTNWALNTWYAWNPVNGAIDDSIKWVFQGGTADSVNQRPRAIAFSNDGLTAYVGCFGTNNLMAFQKFTKGPSSVKPDPAGVPDGFTLAQNYPNPFNPTTEIKFSLGESGHATLKVYDMLGREIAEIVNGFMNAGAYTATFDAGRFSSGTYVYILNMNGYHLSKKMMVLK